MARSQSNSYLKTKVQTARPEELRLMLLDGAVQFADRAREGMLRKNHEQVYDGLTRCQDILTELINSIDPAHDPALCRRLTALYTWMYTRLIDAGRERDPQLVKEVLDLLRYERETWMMLIERLTKGKPDPIAHEEIDAPRRADACDVQG